MRAVLVFAVLLCACAPALAAPFCAVGGHGKDCFYFDEPSCQQAAEAMRGACVVNSAEVRPSGGAPFCVVAGHGADCFYYDAPSCEQAAGAARGACVVNPRR